MSSATVKKFKWFWHDQDVEQEHWLRSMAQQGLHLKKLNVLQQWTFEKGEPADIVYRVDFNTQSAKPEYRLLLEDAGWEQAMEHHGWQYWRTAAVDGRAPEIFTDAKNRNAKFTRLLGLIAISSLPLAYAFFGHPPHYLLEQLSAPFLVLLAAGAFINAVALVRLSAKVLKSRS
jgi:hypothetical protein